MSRPGTEPHLFVVLGGTGDLMRRKLLPALFHLSRQGFLAGPARVLGVGRETDMDDESFRALSREALVDGGFDLEAADHWCETRLHYQPLQDPGGYRALSARVRELEAEAGLPGNRIFYLALPPRAFPRAIEGLGEGELNRSPGWTRLVVEKPFGRDAGSARELNAHVHRHFDESQVYRIDHYLGKETVQNLLVFRLGNQIFESLWNRDRVDNVQITVAEDLGVGQRAGYYDRAGALRDMAQNHLAQLLTLTAMEPPVTFQADAIRNEKVKVLAAVRPPGPGDVVFGQYAAGQVGTGPVPGYRDEPEVAPGSGTETYLGLRLHLDSWRWQGVPFYLRTGKRLARKWTSIAVTFRDPPVCLFRGLAGCDVRSNVLLITLQPDEGVTLRFEVKSPGKPLSIQSQELGFRFHDAFGELRDAYETLLLDILQGDQTLFVRADETEASWELYDPLLRLEREPAPYPAGSWGPEEADALLEEDGRHWVPLPEGLPR